ncbi:MAG: DUF2283 domain-containing protein [Chloroflexi bacterium]|nr:DUF2283 domain-containing protein [Chloroflexota bacterium]
MLVRIDKEADVIYAHWGAAAGKLFSREVAPGVFLEEDEQGAVVGIEVLSASSRTQAGALDHVDVEIFSNELAKK